MSKSHHDPRCRILITDSPEEVSRKIMAALTDSKNFVSYDQQNRPGVSNLLRLLSYFDPSGRSPEELGTVYASLNLREFKILVAESISKGLDGISARYNQILAEDDGRYLDYIAIKGAEKARQSSDATMALIREAVGF